jgi:hypothetical protein
LIGIWWLSVFFVQQFQRAYRRAIYGVLSLYCIFLKFYVQAYILDFYAFF